MLPSYSPRQPYHGSCKSDSNPCSCEGVGDVGRGRRNPTAVTLLVLPRMLRMTPSDLLTLVEEILSSGERWAGTRSFLAPLYLSAYPRPQILGARIVNPLDMDTMSVGCTFGFISVSWNRTVHACSPRWGEGRAKMRFVPF